MTLAPSRQLPASTIAASGVRVLVVDDEADDRVTLGQSSNNSEPQPTVVASAHDALDAIAQTLPDVLLSDVAMPNENGYALIRRIRHDRGRRPTTRAALSAYVDGDSREQALDAGFPDVSVQTDRADAPGDDARVTDSSRRRELKPVIASATSSHAAPASPSRHGAIT